MSSLMESHTKATEGAVHLLLDGLQQALAPWYLKCSIIFTTFILQWGSVTLPMSSWARHKKRQ